jgi:precorrin-2 methylase
MRDQADVTPIGRALATSLGEAHKQRSLIRKIADRRFRAAFLALTDALPRGRNDVPTYASAFNEAARSDERAIAPKGYDVRDLLRAVMDAAVATGGRQVIDDTQLAIERYLNEMRLWIFATVPGFDASAFAHATVEVGRDLAAAQAAITEAGTTRNTSAIETAERVCEKAELSIERFESEADRVLHRSA